MESAKASIDHLIPAARSLIADMRAYLADPSLIWDEIEHINPRLGAVMIIATTCVLGFFILVLLANLLPGPTGNKIKSAITGGSSSGPTSRADSPPIPPATEVVSLRIYPIKSCRGIEVSATRLRKTGLTLDRNWMFISQADRKFLTIRGDPSMTLIDTALVDDPEDSQQQNLQISIHGTDSRVSIPAFPTRAWLEAHTTLSRVEIWEQDTDGWEYDAAINDVFSAFFRKPVALIYKGPTQRMVAVNGRRELYGTATPHHFADVMSLQVASEASIRDLNRRLARKGVPGADGGDLTIERFRPNIIVRGRDDAPWEEDTWKRIRLSTRIDDEQALYKIDLDVVARCARCQVPNVDPDTAEKHAREPWDELMSFRRVDQGGPAKYKPCFGMLCLPRNEGKLRVGAKLEVLETTDKHLYNTRKFSDL